jgi:hypothetical protein
VTDLSQRLGISEAVTRAPLDETSTLCAADSISVNRIRWLFVPVMQGFAGMFSSSFGHCCLFN